MRGRQDPHPGGHAGGAAGPAFRRARPLDSRHRPVRRSAADRGERRRRPARRGDLRPDRRHGRDLPRRARGRPGGAPDRPEQAPGDHRPVGRRGSGGADRARQPGPDRERGRAAGGGGLPLGAGSGRKGHAPGAGPGARRGRLGSRPRDRGDRAARPGSLPRDRPSQRHAVRRPAPGLEARADLAKDPPAERERDSGDAADTAGFNTLGRRIEELQPIEPGHVRLYTCGPTVYNVAHIGNLRTFLWEDVLAASPAVDRSARHPGHEPHRRRRQDHQAGPPRRGCRCREFTGKYADLFFRDIDRLGIQRAERYPRATEHIPEMLEITAKLLERGHAYESEGSVYFRISTFPGVRTAFGDRPLAGAPRATASPTTSTRRKTSRTSSSGRRRSRASRPGTRRGDRAARAGTSSARR